MGGQVGGYASQWTRLDPASGQSPPEGPTRRLSVVTVRGAGHMVPAVRPKQALALIYRALHQQEEGAALWDDESVPTPPEPTSIVLNLVVADQHTVANNAQVTDAQGFLWSVNVGDSVRLTACAGKITASMDGGYGCSMPANVNTPLVFRWSRNGRLLTGAGVPERVSGSVDQELTVSALKPSDAGLYEAEVSTVQGGHIGSMSVQVYVSTSTACTSSSSSPSSSSDASCCQLVSFPNLPDGDGDGCPDEWRGDGECDRALCPHGDAQDCDGGVRSSPLCTDYVEFAVQLDAITSECCDQKEEDCSSGLPAICNTDCAAVLLPAIEACTDFLSSSLPEAVGIGGANVLTQLNNAAQMCHGGH